MEPASLEQAKVYLRSNIRLNGFLLKVIWSLFFFSTAAGIFFTWAGKTDWTLIASGASFFFAINLVCIQIYIHQLSSTFQALILPVLHNNTALDQPTDNIKLIDDRLEQTLERWIDLFGREGAADLMDQVLEIAAKDEAREGK